MALSAGTRFGPYEIIALAGSGGMGEVYRARDTRLQRHVAIKVLPQTAQLTDLAEARLDREARAIAALNHRSTRSADGKRLVLARGTTSTDIVLLKGLQ